MFQSFPLGDRSSVNLRGEYHVENVTVFEDVPLKSGAMMEQGMDIDEKDDKVAMGRDITDNEVPTALQQAKHEDTELLDPTPKAIESGSELQTENNQVNPPNMDTLYPLFWSLQANFSTPTRLFDESNLQAFRRGLESTLRKFKEVQQDLQSRGPAKLHDENKRGVKRKRNGQEDVIASSFNPKYLTSRDLFDLEVFALPRCLSHALADVHRSAILLSAATSWCRL